MVPCFWSHMNTLYKCTICLNPIYCKSLSSPASNLCSLSNKTSTSRIFGPGNCFLQISDKNRDTENLWKYRGKFRPKTIYHLAFLAAWDHLCPDLKYCGNRPHWLMQDKYGTTCPELKYGGAIQYWLMQEERGTQLGTDYESLVRLSAVFFGTKDAALVIVSSAYPPLSQPPGSVLVSSDNPYLSLHVLFLCPLIILTSASMFCSCVLW